MRTGDPRVRGPGTTILYTAAGVLSETDIAGKLKVKLGAF